MLSSSRKRLLQRRSRKTQRSLKSSYLIGSFVMEAFEKTKSLIIKTSPILSDRTDYQTHGFKVWFFYIDKKDGNTYVCSNGTERRRCTGLYHPPGKDILMTPILAQIETINGLSWVNLNYKDSLEFHMYAIDGIRRRRINGLRIHNSNIYTALTKAKEK